MTLFRMVGQMRWMDSYLCELVYDVFVLLSGNKLWLDLPRVKKSAQKGCAGCQPTHAQQTAWLHVHLDRQMTDIATTKRCAVCASALHHHKDLLQCNALSYHIPTACLHINP